MKNVPLSFCGGPFEGILDRICHMNLMHANLCRWPHYCGEMDCLIKHIIRHICRLADQIEAVFFEQIPFVKFVSVHAAVLDLGQREEVAGSLVYRVKVPGNLDCSWRWDNFSTRFISSEGKYFTLPPFVCCVSSAPFSADRLWKYSCTRWTIVDSFPPD